MKPRAIPTPRRTSPDTRPAESVQDWLDRGNTITHLFKPPVDPDSLFDCGVTARIPGAAWRRAELRS